jgi:tryptophan synthase alpha chain
MKNRISSCFEALKAAQKKALIPYVTAGYPNAEFTPQLMHAMVQAGADVIELGVPFSDPSADGPVIQRANEHALAAGVNLQQVLGMVARFRQTNTHTPVVLMGYAKLHCRCPCCGR